MKNLFSKTLLCGVLATSFLLINCQKAPNRAIKAQITPTAKPSAKVGDCTDVIAADLDLLRKSNKKIEDTLKTATDAAADVEVLNNLAKELNALSKKVTGAVEALKVEVCNVHESNDAKKPVKDKANIIDIRQNRSKVGKDIKAKTKVDNEITTEDAAAAAETLSVGQELLVTAELAAVMSDDGNSKGVVAISDSKIEKGATATALLADKTVTACALVITKKEDVKANAKIKILGLEAVKLDDTTKRNVMNVNITVAAGTDGNLAMSYSCNIADGKERDAVKEIRKALGSLVTAPVVVEAAPEAAVVAPPPAAPAPAPAATDAAAKDALNILDTAAARK